MDVPIPGKGFFIWKIPNTEGGSADAIATQAQLAGLTHVLIKIADRTTSSNYDFARSMDYIPPVALALKAAGIQVWGWHYIYGDDPLGEARKAIQRLKELGLDGYAIDAEAEFKLAGKATAAAKFMDTMRSAFPSMPMSLTSYRFPSYHPDFPWKAFLDRVDFNMPQVYWEQAHNPGAQLTRSIGEFAKMTPYRPVLPVGPGYKTGGWAPTEADTKEFLTTAINLGLPSVSFFSWEECRRDLPNIWKTIADFSFLGASGPIQDVVSKYITALNNQDPAQVAGLYTANAVQITASRTVQGTDAIRSWFATFVGQMLPSATFTLTGLTGSGNSRHFTWKATSSKGVINNGNDTLGLIDGKINYHYSFFTITPN